MKPIPDGADGLRDVGEERFHLVARAGNEVIWDWNIETGVCWQSQGIRRFGYSESTGPGERLWLDHAHPDHYKRVLKGVEEVLAARGQCWSDQYPFICEDGAVAEVFNRACVVRDAGGRAIRMVGAMMDMTDYRQAREKIDIQGADQKPGSINSLFGRIAHDLNNVLAPILLGVPLLRERGCDPSSRRILDDIESSAERGAAIVKECLTLARGAPAGPAPLQPNQLIHEMAKILGEAFPKSIRLQTCCDPALWEIEGDAMEIHQVLLNLSVNAQDAMPDGGVLTLSSHNVTLTDPVFCAGLSGQSGQYVQIQVADTGVGMSGELQRKIFQPYFTTKEPGKAAGLGLSTTVRILESHGALLDLTSAPGVGSTFSVYFPAGLRQPPADAVAAQPQPPAGNHELVLLVDDEPEIREMCQFILESFGYRVVTAENGAEALSLMERHKHEISAAIVDMIMPVLDGASTIRAMRSSAPKLKIIATSGLSEKDQAAALGGVAPDISLPKPYSADQLVEALAALLR